jgi:hypothetical protein
MAQNYSYPSSSSVTASVAAVGLDGQPIPLSSILLGAENPSHNLQQLQVDASGNLLISQVSPAPLPAGAATAANQVIENASLASIDSKLTAPLSVTGPLTDVQLRASAVPVSAASLPLPSGAATAANQATEIASLASIDGKLTAPLSVTGPLTDTQLRASAVPVSGPLTDTQLRASPVPVSGTVAVSNFPATQPVSGTVAVSNFPATQPISAVALPLPAGAATSANQSTEIASLASIDSKLGSLGQKAMAGSAPVVIASDQSAVPVKQQIGATSTVTSVSSSATSVSLLASNANRIGATFYNDSTQICYLKLGATASTTSYTIQMAAGSYYELPFQNKMYTGAIDGIWASANGAMRITELV